MAPGDLRTPKSFAYVARKAFRVCLLIWLLSVPGSHSMLIAAFDEAIPVSLAQQAQSSSVLLSVFKCNTKKAGQNRLEWQS